ncbi:Transcriptional activator protein acu-15 [Mycena venus]|uniref:Transcriptional activator protein acu-15 n=1 Tax=Mycena venus TaxID=2733690 RepID=A0A8H7D8M7_9AGAR|nr:Transcriptional activator protein acu-15 [Mycena venus]
MTDPSADSGAHGRPTSYLHRACLNCRRRKIRCDGERPICRRCRLQPPRSLTPCKYSHAPVGGASSPQLQEMVEAMQNRIHELELLTGQDPSQVFLTEPYSTRLQPVETESDNWDNRVPFFGTPSPIEEPAELTGTLMDIFFHHFSRHQFFFLDPTQFEQSATSRPDLLPRSLLNAVALWANRVSANPITIADSTYSEDELLARTLYHVAREITSLEASPQRMLHMIQAEVLLSFYYLDSGRLLEGNYHRAGATSLAFSAGLHQLGSSAQGRHAPSMFLETRIPAQMDTVSKREMIDCFWSVVILNNYCVAVSDVPSSIPRDAQISTPWPTHLPNITSPLPFIDGNEVAGHSPLTLLAKASMQLGHAIGVSARNPGPTQTSEFWAIDSGLENFRSHLPSIDIAAPTDQVSLVTHALVNAAILRLHSPRDGAYAGAQAKCLTAASCVAGRLLDARLSEWEHADPILGTLLAAVADVLIANIPHAPQAAADLHTVLSAMRTLARRSPLIQKYLVATERRYTSAQQSLDLSLFRDLFQN